jgi:hypothetical protein
MRNEKLKELILERIAELNQMIMYWESNPKQGKTSNHNIRNLKLAIAHNEWILAGQPMNLN